MIDEKNQQELIMLSKSMTSGDVFDSALDCIRCLLFTKIICLFVHTDIWIIHLLLHTWMLLWLRKLYQKYAHIHRVVAFFHQKTLVKRISRHVEECRVKNGAHKKRKRQEAKEPEQRLPPAIRGDNSDAKEVECTVTIVVPHRSCDNGRQRSLPHVWRPLPLPLNSPFRLPSNSPARSQSQPRPPNSLLNNRLSGFLISCLRTARILFPLLHAVL
jgi:hypothetical protein